MAAGRIIRQIENKVKITTQSTANDQEPGHIEIQCESNRHALILALSLAGLVEDNSRIEKYRKLQSHPWYGQVIFQQLTSADRKLISIMIEKNNSLTDEQFQISIQRLFIDDSHRPTNHAIIQEVLSLCK